LSPFLPAIFVSVHGGFLIDNFTLIKAISLSLVKMNDEDSSNPWITVSKRRKVNATANGDYSPSFVTKSEAETFHTNSFTNLSIKDIGTDNLASGNDTKDPSNSTYSSSPPHKKNKKEVGTLFQPFTYSRNPGIQA
jgi:hypothetical protein